MKSISAIVALLVGVLASAPAPAGGGHWSGGGGGHWGGGHSTSSGWNGGHGHWSHSCCATRFGFGVVIGPPYWPWYAPYYYPPPVYYAPSYYPPTVVYTNPPVVVTPSEPAYSAPPMAAPGTQGNPVVELPPSNGAQPSAVQQSAPPRPVVAQAAPGQLFMYPRQGQDAQAQARDRDECYRWALGQLGYDSSKSTAGLSPGQSSDYYRAMTACLDGRGYSVR